MMIIFDNSTDANITEQKCIKAIKQTSYIIVKQQMFIEICYKSPACRTIADDVL